MSLTHDRFSLFRRRAFLIGLGQTALFAGLAGRLYQLQVLDGDQYRLRAEDNRISTRLTLPVRGTILDYRGVPLADNHPNYKLILLPEEAGNVRKALEKIRTYFPLSDEQITTLTEQAKRQRSFIPLVVAEQLNWEQLATLEVRTPELPGMQLEQGTLRAYPLGEAAAHVIGYVGAPSDEQAVRDDPVLRLGGMKIGKAGLETVYEKQLRGEAGQRQVEVNAAGREVRLLSETKGNTGTPLVTTLDAQLQAYAYQRLGEEAGSVVVMDVATGAVRALVSAPTYDPNRFSQGISTRYWQELRDNPKAALVNKPVAGQYAPGSTFKMLVALAALRHRVISPEETIHCPGRYRFGNRWFHCWKHQGHGNMAMHAAIKHSCDVYFYEIARRMGIANLASLARDFGLGSTTGLELGGERSGLIPDEAWKRKTHNAAWNPGETINAGIGQGMVLVTPIQLAMMTAQLASGKQIRPTLLQENRQPPSLDMPDWQLKIMRDAMDAVVNSQSGTAWGARLPSDTIHMAGKTGTVQVRGITREERARGLTGNDHRLWHHRDHGMFVGYAPVDAPRLAISVVVEHGGSGSRAAAPVARDVMAFAMGLIEGKPPDAL